MPLTYCYLLSKHISLIFSIYNIAYNTERGGKGERHDAGRFVFICERVESFIAARKHTHMHEHQTMHECSSWFLCCAFPGLCLEVLSNTLQKRLTNSPGCGMLNSSSCTQCSKPDGPIRERSKIQPNNRSLKAVFSSIIPTSKRAGRVLGWLCRSWNKHFTAWFRFQDTEQSLPWKKIIWTVIMEMNALIDQ